MPIVRKLKTVSYSTQSQLMVPPPPPPPGISTRMTPEVGKYPEFRKNLMPAVILYYVIIINYNNFSIAHPFVTIYSTLCHIQNIETTYLFT